jgi:DNA-directed RNA polymerase specialized sigma24 family protein
VIASPAPLVGSTSAGAHSIQPLVVPPGLATKEAERLERLAADIELIDRLMWAGYQGPEWERFRTELARYGIVVLASWIKSGRIFVQCAQRGVRGLRRRPGLVDDALELAGETNASALSYFRAKVLVPRVWNPTRGASISTFFVGACVLHFPNVYRRWLREAGDEQLHPTDRDPALVLEDDSLYARPDRQVELVNTVDNAVRDPMLREIFVLEAKGYTKDEIAAKLDTTAKAVESKLYRFRELRDGKRVR